MDANAWIVNPPLPSLPDWGWPLPIWWVLLLALIVGALWWMRRQRLMAQYRQPWMALYTAVLTASQRPDHRAALLLAEQLKRAQLAYGSRASVAALRVGDSLARFCQQCALPPCEAIQHWLEKACYQGVIETTPGLEDELNHLATALYKQRKAVSTYA